MLPIKRRATRDWGFPQSPGWPSSGVRSTFLTTCWRKLCCQSASVQVPGPESLTQQTGAALRTKMWHPGPTHSLMTGIGAWFSETSGVFFLQKLFRATWRSSKLLELFLEFLKRFLKFRERFLNVSPAPRRFSRVGPVEGLGLNQSELRAGGPELVVWGIAGHWVVTRDSCPCLKNDIAKGNIHIRSLSSLEASLAAHLTCPQHEKPPSTKPLPIGLLFFGFQLGF